LISWRCLLSTFLFQDLHRLFDGIPNFDFQRASEQCLQAVLQGPISEGVEIKHCVRLRSRTRVRPTRCIDTFVLGMTKNSLYTARSELYQKHARRLRESFVPHGTGDLKSHKEHAMMGAKVFTATKAKDRDELGEVLTRGIHDNPRRGSLTRS